MQVLSPLLLFVLPLFANRGNGYRSDQKLLQTFSVGPTFLPECLFPRRKTTFPWKRKQHSRSTALQGILFSFRGHYCASHYTFLILCRESQSSVISCSPSLPQPLFS